MALSRRGFLFGSGAAMGFAAAAGSLGTLGLLESTAHATLSYPGYRALVCLFLLGGNDGNNMVIPTTATGYAKYAAVRPASGIGIPLADMQSAGTLLNPVGGVAGSYGLHPKMPKLARLFNGVDANGAALAGGPKMAIVPNVGPLVAPMTKAQYIDGSVEKPAHLFSHSDQQAAWDTSIADPLSFPGLPTGWGGRMSDVLSVENPGAGSGYPDATSLSGLRLFTVGASRKPIVVPSNGVLGRLGTGSATIDAIRDGAAAQILGLDAGNSLTDAYRDVYESSLADATQRAGAVSGNPLPADVAALFPATPLGTQLKQIAQEILAGAATGGGGLAMKRQVFFAAIGSFDTHTDQLVNQGSLLSQVDNAMEAFYKAIAMINTKVAGGALPNLTGPVQATTFTMSDFGRTFEPNSNGGSDHAWGNHMLVLGDQVVGGKLFGSFPDLTLGGPTDVGDEGRWLPGRSVEKYAWTLMRWMGVANSKQPLLLPNAVNFLTAGQTVMSGLGFMTA